MSFIVPDICPICARGVKKTPDSRDQVDFDCCSDGERCFWGFNPHYFYFGLTNVHKYDTICFRYDVGIIDLYECRGSTQSIEIPIIDLDLQDSAAVQRFIKNIPKLLLL